MPLFAFPAFPELETPRLRLRETQPDDAEALFRILSQPEVVQFYNIGPLESIDEARAIIERRRASYLQGSRIRWAIVWKDSGHVLGSCGYVNPNELSRQAEIGYELDRDYWGQGVMREALTAMLAFGFTTAGLHRIEARVVPENTPSQRLLAKLGFHYEGLLRESGYWKNSFHDLALYALLQHEWSISTIEGSN